VPGDRPTTDQLRVEIRTEREQLARALADLREAINSKRRPATAVGGALAAGLATRAAFRVARRLRRR
jgi:hypothetical protein